MTSFRDNPFFAALVHQMKPNSLFLSCLFFCWIRKGAVHILCHPFSMIVNNWWTPPIRLRQPLKVLLDTTVHLTLAKLHVQCKRNEATFIIIVLLTILAACMASMCSCLGNIILYICHGHHRQCPWRNNLPCGEISPHDRLPCGKNFHLTNCHVEKALHMRNVKNICNVVKWCVQFMVFCRFKLL